MTEERQNLINLTGNDNNNKLDDERKTGRKIRSKTTRVLIKQRSSVLSLFTETDLFLSSLLSQHFEDFEIESTAHENEK